MFQPTRTIARTLLVPAALAAVALTGQSAASASALPVHHGSWSGGNWYAVVAGGTYHLTTGSGNWHLPSGTHWGAVAASGNAHASAQGGVHHVKTTGGGRWA